MFEKYNKESYTSTLLFFSPLDITIDIPETQPHNTSDTNSTDSTIEPHTTAPTTPSATELFREKLTKKGAELKEKLQLGGNITAILNSSVPIEGAAVSGILYYPNSDNSG